MVVSNDLKTTFTSLSKSISKFEKAVQIEMSIAKPNSLADRLDNLISITSR